MDYTFGEKPSVNLDDIDVEPGRFGGFNLRKLLIVVFGILVLILVGTGLFFLIKNFSGKPQPAPQTHDYSKDNIFVSIADSMSSTTPYESLVISVSNLKLHEKEKGWINVSGDIQQYDLVALHNKGAMALISSRELDPANYDQVELMINKVEIVDKGEKKEAKIPLGDMKIYGNFVIGEEGQAAVMFDVMTDKSLFVVDDQTIVFVPSLWVKSRSNTNIQVNESKEITVPFGDFNTNKKIGMDVNGEIKTDFQLDSATKLTMIGNVIKVSVFGDTDKSLKISPIMAINSVTNDGYLDRVVSIKLAAKNNEKVWMVSGLKNMEVTNVYINAITGAFVISQNAQYESCVATVDVIVNQFNTCTTDLDCTGIALACGTRSVNNFFKSSFADRIKDIQAECDVLFGRQCDAQAQGPSSFLNRCIAKKCVAVLKPVYEAQLEDVRFAFQSAENLGSVLKSTKQYVNDLTTTERFIKVVVGAQNKGKGTIPAFSWDLGSIVDSEGRTFAPITTKAYEFLPKPDLCGVALEPEFDLIRCTRMYEVSKVSTGLRIEVLLRSPKVEKALLDLNPSF